MHSLSPVFWCKIVTYLLKIVGLQMCKLVLWVETPPACISVMGAVVTSSILRTWTALMLSVCIVGTGHLPQLHYEEALPAAHERRGALGGHRFHCCFVSMWIWSFGFCSEGSLLADVWSTAPWLKHQIQDSNNVHQSGMASKPMSFKAVFWWVRSLRVGMEMCSFLNQG